MPRFILWNVCLLLPLLCRPAAAVDPDDSLIGREVTVSAATDLWSGEDSLGTIAADTRFKVLEISDTWLLGEFKLGGTSLQGWVAASDVVLVQPAASPAGERRNHGSPLPTDNGGPGKAQPDEGADPFSADPKPYLKGPEVMVQLTPADSVEALDFSRDGRFLAVASSDRQTYLYETNGRLARVFANPAMGRPESVSLSPDGRWIAMGYRSGKERHVVVFETASGKQIATVDDDASQGRWGPTIAQFADDGQLLLTSFGGPEASVRNFPDLKVLHRFVHEGTREEHGFDERGRRAKRQVPHVIQTAKLSPDGKYLLTGDAEFEVRLWDVSSGRQLKSFEAYTNEPDTISFAADGKSFLLSAFGAQVTQYSLPGAEPLRTVRVADKKAPSSLTMPTVTTATLDASGQRLIAGDDDGDFFFGAWDMESEERLHTFGLQRHSSSFISGGTRVSRLCRAPDGKSVAAAISNRVEFWDVQSGKRTRCIGSDLVRETNPAFVGTSMAGQTLVTGRVVWQMELGRPQELLGQKTEKTTVDPDGNWLLTGNTVWDPKTGRGIEFLKTENHNVVTEVSVNDTGTHVAILYNGSRQAQLWDMRSRRLVDKFGVERTATAAAVSRDGKMIAVGTLTNNGDPDLPITVWTAPERGSKWSYTELRGHTDSPMTYALAFNPDATRLASGSSDDTARIWDLATGRSIVLRGHKGNVTAVAFSPDGSRLLTGSSDGTAMLWEVDSGKRLATLSGHTDTIESVAFRPDGRLLMTGSDDNTWRLWDGTTGQPVAEIFYFLDGQDWLVTTPDGLFDGSTGARQRVMYRVGSGLNVVPVDRFFNSLFRPGLLAEIWRGDQPRSKIEIGQSLPPTLAIETPGVDGELEQPLVEVDVTAVDEGGGIHGPSLFVNGVRLAGAVQQTWRDGDRVIRKRFSVPLVEGVNRIEGRAYSADESWQSEPAQLVLHYRRPLPKPRIHLLLFAVGDYGQEELDLAYPTGDMGSIVELFQRRGGSLYASVNVTTLRNEEVTQESVFRQLDALASEVNPQDTVMVALAGQGAFVDNEYFFLTHDFQQGDLPWDSAIQQQGLPLRQIGERLSRLPAQRRLVVVEASHSGAIGLERTGRNAFGFRKAIERLTHAEGAFALASLSTGGKFPEVDDLGHGMMVYTLLAGMGFVERGPLRDRWIDPMNAENVVDAVQWFGFASRQTRALGQKYFGTRHEVYHTIAADSFPVLPLPDHVSEPGGADTADAQTTPAEQPERRRTQVALQSDSPRHPRIIVCTVGINQYEEASISLKYARQDAEAIARLFEDRGLAKEIQVVSLLDEQATREGILNALDELSETTRPDDVLVLFFSGHGVTVGDRYYFIPQDFAQQTDESVGDAIRRAGISSDKLTDVLREVPAKRRFMVLDTCASASALQLRHSDQNQPGSQAFGELAGQAGIFMVAAASAHEEAQEVGDLRHGILTYSLLAGAGGIDHGPLARMPIQPDDRWGNIDVLDWISYAVAKTPLLMKRYFGDENQLRIAGTGNSFPLLELQHYADSEDHAARHQTVRFQTGQENDRDIPIVDRPWQVFEDPDGRFTVTMPGRPGKSSGRLPVYRLEVDGEDLRFEVVVMDFDVDDIEPATFENPSFVRNVTDKLLKSLIDRMYARLKYSKTNNVEGHVVRDFALEFWKGGDPWLGIGRIYVTNRKIFILTATGPRDGKYSAARNRFFSTFQLTD